MSTFFEKLTGSQKDADTEEQETPYKINATANTTASPSRQRTARKTPSETHLKVSDESESARESEADEEEGELTVDIYDKEDTIVIQSTVAGVKPEDLDISITNDSVTIRGKRERFEETKESDYYYKELFWGTFIRSVILPEEIEEDEAEAVLKHGLLTIKLPKKKRGRIQKVKIKVT